MVKCIALRRMNAASSKKADPYVIGKAAVRRMLGAVLYPDCIGMNGCSPSPCLVFFSASRGHSGINWREGAHA